MKGIIDQTRDTNKQYRYSLLNMVDSQGNKLFDPPDYVKAAADEKVVGSDSVAPSLYADPRARLFPCHNAAATWWSAACFHSQKEAMAKNYAASIEKRLNISVQFHGIGPSVDRIKKAVDENFDKSLDRLPDSDFALVVQWEGAEKERHLPLRNAAEVKAAAEYIRKHRDEFDYDQRRTVAAKALAKAAKVGADAEDCEFLRKVAGHGTCSAETAASLLFERAKVLRRLHIDPDLQENLAKTAQNCLKNPEYVHRPANLQRLASLIERTDEDCGLKKLSALTRPEDALFSIDLESMSRVRDEHIQLNTGSIYKKADVSKISLSAFEGLFGTSFAQQLSADGLFVDGVKLASTLKGLDRPNAELFERLASHWKVQPIFKQASGQAFDLLEGDTLKEMAALHKQVA